MQEDVQIEKEKNYRCREIFLSNNLRNPRSSRECYFCINEVQGFTIKTKSKIVYHAVESATAPVEIEKTDRDIDRIIDSEKSVEYQEFENLGDTSEDESISRSEYAPTNEKSKIPYVVSQMELNDLVRDLGLPKDGSELLVSFL